MESHDHGLAADLDMMLQATSNRRQSLRWLLAGAPGVPLFGCGGAGDSDASATTTATGTSDATTPASTDTASIIATPATPATPAASTDTATTGSSGTCAAIPEEAGGPYAADGTNSTSGGVVNVSNLSAIVRKDIRSSVAGFTGTAGGVPLTIRLQLVNASGSCALLSGYAVYLGHCTSDDLYSLDSSGVTGQNYLRGVQQTDASGNLEFTSIFPGCYLGRMPHVHFEVYPTVAKSTSAVNRLKTSQFTFPLAPLNEVYATTDYSASVRNLAQISYATDNVFSDGTALQMGSVSGNATDG